MFPTIAVVPGFLRFHIPLWESGYKGERLRFFGNHSPAPLLCYTRKSPPTPPTSRALTSLFVSHQTVGRCFRRSYITFCVAPDGRTLLSALLHHFLCRTRRADATFCSLASLFVSHQTVRRYFHALTSLFVSHQTAGRYFSALTSLFVSYQTAGRYFPLLASLFVSHQTGGRYFPLPSITICVTPDGGTLLQRSNITICVIPDGQTLLPLSCITICVTPDGRTLLSALLHHYWCR